MLSISVFGHGKFALLVSISSVLWILFSATTTTPPQSSVGVFHIDTPMIPLLPFDLQTNQEFQSKNNLSSLSLPTKPFCRSKEEYTNGNWIWDSSIDSYPYLSAEDFVWGKRCTEIQKKYLTSNSMPDFLRYRWQPSTCDIARFNPETFCRIMDGKTIGIIGDSMQQQFAHSLMGLMHGKIEDSMYGVPTVWSNETYFLSLKVPLCRDYPQHNNVTMRFVRWNKFKPYQTEDQTVLAELISVSDYLIFNWGVHYLPWLEMENSTKSFIEVLEKHWDASSKPSERLFWRSTVVAHANCSEATAPEIGSINGTYAIHPYYNTDEILLQDEHIVRPLLDQSFLNVTVLHIESSSLLRRDGHRVIGHNGKEDCLHYCEPGPVDSWVQLFYHHVVVMDI